jgi:hypothetical protein
MRLYLIVAKIFSGISFSPPHLKGSNFFFDGHRTSPLVSFDPPLTLSLAGGSCEKIAKKAPSPYPLPPRERVRT